MKNFRKVIHDLQMQAYALRQSAKNLNTPKGGADDDLRRANACEQAAVILKHFDDPKMTNCIYSEMSLADFLKANDPEYVLSETDIRDGICIEFKNDDVPSERIPQIWIPKHTLYDSLFLTFSGNREE